MRTHAQKILDYMERNGSITTMEAYSFGCTCLAQRIFDLKRKGYKINDKKERNRSGKGYHSIYSLEQENTGVEI